MVRALVPYRHPYPRTYALRAAGRSALVAGVPIASNRNMAAVATTTERAPETAPAPAVAAVPVVDDSAQLAVERTVFRCAAAGMLIGAVVCAGIWTLIVLLALAGKGFALGPMLAVGVVCGVFAGFFLGGCAGMLVGGLKLEHFEHEHRAG